MQVYVYFRNDDVNTLDKELIKMTEIFTRERVPIIHAVEPANVKNETVSWLIGRKQENPNLIEIMQHGFDHKIRFKGEFGGRRPYDDQVEDLSKGKRIMQKKFGKLFLNAINFPYGPYNMNTIRAVDELKFDIISSHYSHLLSRRAMYYLGNLMKKGQIFGKHVSHHMQMYPKTRLFEIDMCISFIREYIGGYNSRECIFENIDFLMNEYSQYKKHTNVVGFLLHHRYHHRPKSIALIQETINRLRKDKNIQFTNLSTLYKKAVKK